MKVTSTPYGPVIMVRYFGPTNYRGSRLIVTCDELRKVYGYRSELNPDRNREAAVLDFVTVNGFGDRGWKGYTLKNGDYVFAPTID